MIFGISIIAASVFIKRNFHLGKLAYLYTIAGAGTLGVGIFPENTFIINGVPVLHSISALLAFVVGALSTIVTFKITKIAVSVHICFFGCFFVSVFGFILSYKRCECFRNRSRWLRTDGCLSHDFGLDWIWRILTWQSRLIGLTGD